MSTPRTSHHLVRPRWLWAGLAVAILGMLLISWGIMATAWPWWAAGCVVLVVGVIGMLYGGLMYDAHTDESTLELREIQTGGAHEGIDHDEAHPSAAARRDARETDERRKRLLRESMAGPRPAPHRASAFVLLLVALFQLISTWGIYSPSSLGQNNADRSLGLGIVIGLCALRIISVTVAPHRIAAGIATLAGLTFVGFGLFGHHSRSLTPVTETVSGVVTILAALLVFFAKPPTSVDDL